MDQLLTNILTVIGLVLGGCIIGAIVFGIVVKGIIAAQPAPVINNSAEAHADGGGGGGGGGAVNAVGVLAIIALTAWAATGFKTGAVDRAAGDVPINQRAAAPQAQPIVVATIAPTAAPLARSVPAAAPQAQPVEISPTTALGVLAALFVAADAVGLILLLRRQRAIKAEIAQTVRDRVRTERLNEILPDAVSTLEEQR